MIARARQVLDAAGVTALGFIAGSILFAATLLLVLAALPLAAAPDRVTSAQVATRGTP